MNRKNLKIKTETSVISLRELNFYAYHGVAPLEQEVGSRFVVNVDLHLTVRSEALEGDDLKGTVNYAQAYEVVSQSFMPTCRLVEQAAWRVGRALLENFEQVHAVEVSVEKLSPPMEADCKSAAISLKLTREA